MPCFHPLKGFILRVDPDGTKKLKITSYQVDHVEVSFNGDNVVCTTQKEQLSPRYRVVREFLTLPCGKCWSCRLNYSRTWANRLMMELENHKEAWFLTLTYDNDHVPVHYYSDPETGEAHESLSLDKRDWQLFMKRLRKEYSDEKLRFFMSGEYGSQTARPHYHAIVYDLHFEDGELIPYKKSNNFQLFRSERLSNVWQKGFVVVAPVTWETCAYTARYVLKKANGPLGQFYSDFNLQPEFCLMSRRPGIAREYFEQHIDQIYEFDQINLSTGKKGINCKPPTYFDKLFDQIDHDRLSDIKVQRQIAAERQIALELEKTDLDYLDYLSIKEKEAIDRQKILLRRNKCETENETGERQKGVSPYGCKK